MMFTHHAKSKNNNNNDHFSNINDKNDIFTNSRPSSAASSSVSRNRPSDKTTSRTRGKFLRAQQYAVNSSGETDQKLLSQQQQQQQAESVSIAPNYSSSSNFNDIKNLIRSKQNKKRSTTPTGPPPPPPPSLPQHQQLHSAAQFLEEEENTTREQKHHHQQQRQQQQSSFQIQTAADKIQPSMNEQQSVSYSNGSASGLLDHSQQKNILPQPSSLLYSGLASIGRFVGFYNPYFRSTPNSFVQNEHTAKNYSPFFSQAAQDVHEREQSLHHKKWSPDLQYLNEIVQYRRSGFTAANRTSFLTFKNK